jgi:hypothetical protein
MEKAARSNPSASRWAILDRPLRGLGFRSVGPGAPECRSAGLLRNCGSDVRVVAPHRARGAEHIMFGHSPPPGILRFAQDDDRREPRRRRRRGDDGARSSLIDSTARFAGFQWKRRRARTPALRAGLFSTARFAGWDSEAWAPARRDDDSDVRPRGAGWPRQERLCYRGDLHACGASHVCPHPPRSARDPLPRGEGRRRHPRPGAGAGGTLSPRERVDAEGGRVRARVERAVNARLAMRLKWTEWAMWTTLSTPSTSSTATCC